MESFFNFNKSDKQSKSPKCENFGDIYSKFIDYDKVKNLVVKICNGRSIDQTIIDSFVHIFYLMFRFFKSDNTPDFMVSILYIVRNFYRDMYGSFEEYIKKNLFGVVEIINETKRNDAKKMKSESSDFSSTMKLFVNSNIFKVVREFLLDLVSLKFFSVPTSKIFIRTLGIPERKPLFDACISMCESIERMFIFMQKAWKAGTLKGVLMEDTPVLQFHLLFDEIVSAHPNIYLGDECNFSDNEQAEGRMSAFKFMDKLRNVIQIGKDLLATHPQIKTKLNALNTIYGSSLHKLQSHDRKMPIGFVIHGNPGIGKSSILVHLYKLLCKKRGLKYSKNLVYDRLVNANFWDGFDPLSNIILHYPEVGALNVSIAASKGDPTAEELLTVMDTAPLQAEQASIENKGKYFINPEMVVIDTNNARMNLEFIVNNPAAVQRRFYYIEVHVKDVFRLEGTNALDTAKVAALKFDDAGNRMFNDMDLFDFTLYKLQPIDSRKSDKKVIIRGDIYDLSNRIMTLFSEHDEAQDNLTKAMNDNIDNYVSEGLFSQPLYYFNVAWFFLVDWFYSNRRMKKHKLLLFYYLCSIRFEEEYNKRFTPSNVFDNFYNSHWYGDVVLVCSLISLACFLGKTVYNAEGNLVDSSNTFKDNNECKIYTDGILKKSGVEFPRPAKKGDDDVDYDNPQSCFPRIISSQRNYCSFDEVYNTISNNVRYFKVEYDDSYIATGRLLGIKGGYAIMNTHYFTCPHKILRIKISGSSKKMNYRNVSFDSIQFKHLNDDITLIKLFSYQFKDISFALSEDLSSYGKVFAKIDKHTMYANLRPKLINVNNKGGVPFTVEKSYAYIYPESGPGKCGLPLVGKINNQTFLLGIHCAGNSSHSCVASQLTTQILKDIDTFGSNILHPFFSEGDVRLKKHSGTVPEIVEPSRRSPLLYENTDGLNIIGFMKDHPFISPKSTLVVNPMVNDIQPFLGISPYDDNGNLKWDKPLMRSVRRDGEYINPYNLFIRKASVVKKTIPIDDLKNSVAFLSTHILINLKKEGITSLSPCDIDVALNGTHNNFYIRSMKFSTSAGFTFNGKKSKYSHFIGDSDKRDLDYDVHEQVCEILESYSREECSMSILGAQLKDEPRTRAKCLKGKTRVFAMSPFDMTIVQRMYLLSFYSLMPEFGNIFKTAIGINMHSKQAHDMYTQLTDFSPHFLLGDYGGYDTSMPIGIGMAANSIVYNVLKNMGYNNYAMQMVSGIMNDNLFPVLCIEGNLVQIPGFQPSGKYATAEDNSLRNLVCLLIAFRNLCSSNDDININKPFDYIMPVIYGDDLVCAIKPTVTKLFNNITYSNYCEKHFGMTFTTADKQTHYEEYNSIEDVEFLKRKFRYSPILNRVVAALSKESLLKTLTWVLPSKDISVYNQSYESLISVITELFFWCDTEDDYNNYYNIACDMLTKLSLESDLLPSFDVLKKRYTSL